jgi:hypothetical protein
MAVDTPDHSCKCLPYITSLRRIGYLIWPREVDGNGAHRLCFGGLPSSCTTRMG